jgi:RNA polymerase sigma factor (sigma-70 family)
MNIDFLSMLAKYHDTWISHAISLGAKKSFAEDVVQNTYLKLHKYANYHKVIAVNGEPNYGYVYLTIRSEVMNHYNKKKREAKVVSYDFTFTEDEPNMEKHEKNHELFLKTEQILDSLDWYSASLFRMYRDTGKSYRAIGRETGICYVSIHNTINLVKDALKEELSDWYNKNIRDDD